MHALVPSSSTPAIYLSVSLFLSLSLSIHISLYLPLPPATSLRCTRSCDCFSTRQPERLQAAELASGGGRRRGGAGSRRESAARLSLRRGCPHWAEEAEEAEEHEEDKEAKEAEEAHRMQLQAPQGARAIAVQAGAAEAAAVWRCTPCACDAIFCEPCPGCGASQPAHAMQAAIAAVRPLLDAATPDGSGAANDAFHRGTLDGYAVGMSGVFREHPATFRLAEPRQLPALPAPLSDTVVREMRLVLSVCQR